MTEQIYNKGISHYVAKTYGWAIQEQLLLLPHYKKLIGNLKGKSVLDIGCGNGWLTYLLGKKAREVLGCDVSGEMINLARKEHLLPNMKYAVLDATKIESLGRKFDIITCSLMLHASRDKKALVQTLRGANSLLNKNGSMVILVPHPCFSTQNKRDYNTYTFSQDFNYFEDDQEYRVKLVSQKGTNTFTNKFYNLEDYFDAFRKAGFVVNQIIEPHVLDKYLSKYKNLWTSELKIPFYLIFKITRR